MLLLVSFSEKTTKKKIEIKNYEEKRKVEKDTNKLFFNYYINKKNKGKNGTRKSKKMK